MHQPMNRRTFAAALATLTASVTARPLAAKPEPDPDPLTPTTSATIVVYLTEVDEDTGAIGEGSFAARRQGSEPWHTMATLPGEEDGPINPELAAALDALRLADKTGVAIH